VRPVEDKIGKGIFKMVGLAPLEFVFQVIPEPLSELAHKQQACLPDVEAVVIPLAFCIETVVSPE
jgi:hypothetical protein